MGKIKYTEGTGIPHRSFEEEFLTHKKCSEWWYCTGVLDEAGSNRLFSYMFILAKIKILGLRFHLLIGSVTDFAEQKHYNIQYPIFFGKGITSNNQLISVDRKIRLDLKPNRYSSMGAMTLHMESAEFTLDTQMETTKPPIWHCDNGALKMGVQDDPKERTYYYSFTNLKTTGKLTLNGHIYNNLTGKTWFDRQGGPYAPAKPEAAWEWFSLRFFDNSEAMLFSFPRTGYFDGTRIGTDGSYHRMNDYKLETTKVITYDGREFSGEWKLTMEGKNYTLIPKIDGMFNIYFFEQLAGIYDEGGKEVGYCFVELLDGVRNRNKSWEAFITKK